MKKIIEQSLLLCLLLLASGAAGGQHRRHFRDGRPDLPPVGLSPRKEGRFPIALPESQGIDSLLVLDQNWIIAVGEP